jgi:hypothetical protein
MIALDTQRVDNFAARFFNHLHDRIVQSYDLQQRQISRGFAPVIFGLFDSDRPPFVLPACFRIDVARPRFERDRSTDLVGAW